MDVVRGFALSALIWGVVGMSVGLLIALQLAWPELNLGPYFHFGRLRPVHTNVVIFGFTLGVVFAGSYYGVQRLCRARLPSDFLARLHLWLWNIGLVLAGLSLVSGHTSSKEYAELEWPLDIVIVVIWVIYGVNFFGTVVRRRERGLYAAIWFWGATILTIAMLYIANNLAMPVSLLKSYSIYAGVHDANIQWWYGHNAVGFVLTTPILGLMYYFLPRQVDRPIYSHRLSILHFWSLIFVYIWAGPHHLLFSPLPDWVQSRRHGVLGDAALAVVGRDAERPAHAARRLGARSHRSDPEDVRRRTDLLRHEHVRGSDDGDQDGERALALHQLDRRARALRARSAGSPSPASRRSTTWCRGSGTRSSGVTGSPRHISGSPRWASSCT